MGLGNHTRVENPIHASEPRADESAQLTLANVESVDTLTKDVETFWQWTGALPGTISAMLGAVCCVIGIISVLCGVMPSTKPDSRKRMQRQRMVPLASYSRGSGPQSQQQSP